MKREVQLTSVDAHGRVSQLRMPITHLKTESRLHMRELLIVEQPGALLQPRILPRRHCIIVTIGYVRAIVFTDRIYLFSPQIPQVQAYAEALSNHIRRVYNMNVPVESGMPRVPLPTSTTFQYGVVEPVETELVNDGEDESGLLGQYAAMTELGGTSRASDSVVGASPVPLSPAPASMGVSHSGNSGSSGSSGSSGLMRPDDIAPFEMLAIEHALLVNQIRQAKRVSYARRVLDSILAKVETVERDDANLYALFPLANTLSHYEMISRGLTECIRALLDDDRDMREACLSDKVRLSQAMSEVVAASSRAHIAAFDPSYHSETRGEAGLLSGSIRYVSPGSVAELEGTDAYLGHATSPIDSHREVSRVLRTNPALQAHIDQETHLDASFQASTHRPSYDQEGSSNSRSNGANGATAPRVGGIGTSNSTSSYTSARSDPTFDGVSSESLPPILRVSPDALSQLELMLESIYHKAAETTMNVVELSRTLKNKQELLELQQSNYRNFVLSVSLRMGIVSASVSLATFLTSAFGMNLVSGLESNKYAFPLVAATSTAVGVYVYSWVAKQTWSNSPTRKYAKQLQTFQAFLYKMDSALDAAKSTLTAARHGAPIPPTLPGPDAIAASEHGFGLEDDGTMVQLPKQVTKASSGRLNKKDFKALHKVTTGRDISEDEVDLLFDLMDANRDGELELSEVVGVFQHRDREGGGRHEATPLATGTSTSIQSDRGGKDSNNGNPAFVGFFR